MDCKEVTRRYEGTRRCQFNLSSTTDWRFEMLVFYKIQDACILLAGHRCYREYPMEWIQQQILQLLQQKNQNDESVRDREGATKDKKDDNTAPVADCSTLSSSSSSPSLYLLSSQTFSILYQCSNDPNYHCFPIRTWQNK
jgi:hypothetical protein